MPGTVEASALTNGYRTGLIAADLLLLTRVGGQWDGIVDPTDIAGSTDLWTSFAVAATVTAQTQAAAHASAYLTRFAAAETGETVVPEISLATHVGVTSTGTPLGYSFGYPKVRALGLIADGMDVPEALQSARAAALGIAGGAHFNAARATLADAMDSDTRVAGWQRVTGARACGFCAMLATRGPVYREGTGNFRAHTHCTCTAEPVLRVKQRYSRRPPVALPPTVNEINAAAATAANQITGKWTGSAFTAEYTRQRASVARAA